MSLEVLLSLGLTIAVAESITAGGIGHKLTSIPGASNFFWGGFITYSNRSKIELLGVREESLTQYGAVSDIVVREMAKGARIKSGCDIALAITGDAGPDPIKKTGTVFIAVSKESGDVSKKFSLKGARDEIRKDAIKIALDFLIEKAIES